MAALTVPSYLCILQTAENETVLEALYRHSILWPYRCKTGVCHACMTHALEGQPPLHSQKGLSPSQQQRGFFLACQCIPEENLTIALPEYPTDSPQTAVVQDATLLTPTLLRLRLNLLNPLHPFPYQAGQYITLENPEGLMREYALVSTPCCDPYLEFHIQYRSHGRMSQYLYNHFLPDLADSGSAPHFIVHRARGTFVLPPLTAPASLVMVGISAGVAPLWGLLREALFAYPDLCLTITLYHAALTLQDLYLDSEFRHLEQQHAGFHYIRFVPETPLKEADPFTLAHPIQALLKQHPADLNTTQLFLCGDADAVHSLREWLFSAGARPENVHVETFTPFDPLTLAG